MRFELIIGHGNAELLDIQELIFSGLEAKVSRICMPCGLIPVAKSIYPDGPYGSIIGYPYGIDSTQLKLHAILESARKGVKHVEVVLNQFHIRNLDYKLLSAELDIVKKMTADNGIGLRIVIEHRLESLSRNIQIAKLVDKAGIDNLVTSTGNIASHTADGIVHCYKIRENTDLQIITYSNTWTPRLLESLDKAGGFIARTSRPDNIF